MPEITPEAISRAREALPSLWVEKYKLLNEAGLPMEFGKHKFMEELYNDLSPLQVWLKPPQIGATVAQIIKTFWVAHKLGKDIIYTLPTQSDVQDMAGGKINRLVAQNPHLKSLISNHDTVEQKLVGKNIIYYRGTYTNKQAMMVSSDLNVHDEVDASDPAVITQYETRLQAKADGWRWYFSHPSLAGHGVDVYWQQSDKKEWFIKCPCGRKQILMWPRNIKGDKYVCCDCGTEISDAQRERGEWIATSEGIFSGYHISQLMCPWITAAHIIKEKNDPKKDTQYFYNYVLGLPFVASENKIAPEVVLANCVPKVNDQEGVVIIGVDTGLPIHFVCANAEGAFHYATCKDYNELERLLSRWPKSIIVADQGGDLIGIRSMQEKYPGRVYLCYYRKDRKTTEVIQWGTGEEYGKVVVDRNRMIQLIVEQLRDKGRIVLNGAKEDWKELASHFDNIYREQVVVSSGPGKDDHTLYSNEFVWKRTGADHFVHALLYALVGLDKYGKSMAKIVGQDMLASLPTGRMFYE